MSCAEATAATAEGKSPTSTMLSYCSSLVAGTRLHQSHRPIRSIENGIAAVRLACQNHRRRLFQLANVFAAEHAECECLGTHSANKSMPAPKAGGPGLMVTMPKRNMM